MSRARPLIPYPLSSTHSGLTSSPQIHHKHHTMDHLVCRRTISWALMSSHAFKRFLTSTCPRLRSVHCTGRSSESNASAYALILRFTCFTLLSLALLGYCRYLTIFRRNRDRVFSIICILPILETDPGGWPIPCSPFCAYPCSFDAPAYLSRPFIFGYSPKSSLIALLSAVTLLHNVNLTNAILIKDTGTRHWDYQDYKGKHT